jgi:hypothetical protein
MSEIAFMAWKGGVDFEGVLDMNMRVRGTLNAMNVHITGLDSKKLNIK